MDELVVMDKPVKISREQQLEVENINLKLHITRLKVNELDSAMKAAVQKLYTEAGLSSDEYLLDLDKGVFVKK